MQTVKQQTIELLAKLPDESSLDDILEVIWVQKKILTAQEQIRAGQGITHEEAKKRLEKWMK